MFAKISEPELTVINVDDPFLDRMGEVDRGHIEVFPKLWNLRPPDKTNGEITRIPRLMAAYHKVREETKGWSDYKKLREKIPDFPLIRMMLLGAVSAVHTPRMGGFETNERRIAKVSEKMDPCFIGRNVALLQCKQFFYTDETTRRRMNNAATLKHGQFEEERKKLDLASKVMRRKADLQEASMILTSVNSEYLVSGKLHTRTVLAPFGCEEIRVMHGGEEDWSAGRLVVPRFPDGWKNDEQGPSSSRKDQKRDDEQGGSRRSDEPTHQDQDQGQGEDDTAWISSLDFNFLSGFKDGTESAGGRLSQQRRDLLRWNLHQPSWEQTETCRRAALRTILKTPNRNS